MTHHILITGANGQLGRSIQALAPTLPPYTYYYTDADTLDITDAAQLDDFAARHRIDCIINCAAYTAVDRAETEAEQAMRLNCDAVGILAQTARNIGARMLHVSTDYVFDGSATTPYREDDPVSPASAYGRTKLAGEEALMRHLPDAAIVRTAWLYSEYGNNFVKTMLRLGNERNELGVVADQTGTPTYAADLAAALLAMAVHPRWKPGIFHYTNDGQCTWYDFATRIMQLGQRPCHVRPITTAEYPTPARRPAYSVLDKSKIRAAYPVAIPHWDDALQRCMQAIAADTAEPAGSINR